jgi:hypothetical protein
MPYELLKKPKCNGKEGAPAPTRAKTTVHCRSDEMIAVNPWILVVLLAFFVLFLLVDRQLQRDLHGALGDVADPDDVGGDATSGAFSFLWKKYSRSKKHVEPDTRKLNVLVTGAAGFGE